MKLLFEGRPIDFEGGDTIAEALLRSGVTAFSRGPKYHRPRGPFCLNDTCAQCHMRVAGEPNVATCVTVAAEGIEVERQNVVGSGDTDLLRAVDFLYPEGLDHHHLMTRFKLLGSAAQAIARRLAGVGRVPSTDAELPKLVRRDEDVVVVGAGPAGLGVAAALVRAGVRPLVFESRATGGGWVAAGFGEAPATADVGELRLSTRVLGHYPRGDGGQIIARGEGEVWDIRVRRVVVATGAIERSPLFEGNDLPGVFAGRAFTRLRTMPGERAIVVASQPDAMKVADLVAARGVAVEILDETDALPNGPRVVRGRALQALGGSRVSGLRIQQTDGQERILKCDLILSVLPLAPAFELAAEVGVSAALTSDGFTLLADESGATSVPWLRVAGAVCGHKANLERVAASVAH